jgi:putative Holliday junction resolvase
MRYLGIDYGTKRVGLALSDESGAMGFPHSTLPNSGRLIDEVLDLITRKEVGAIVIGESRGFDGVLNPVAKAAKEFGTLLERRTSLPVSYEPETLTTQEARRNFEGVREPGSGSLHVDASAAALILTSFLDRQSNHESR